MTPTHVAGLTVVALLIGLGIGYLRGRWIGEQRVLEVARLRFQTELENRELREDMNSMLNNQMSN